MKADLIRNKFIAYFTKQEHVVVPSSPIVPDNDPSVLFTTAGMQQFKPYFLGVRDPNSDLHSRRLTSIQQCFRTSDIDSVGDSSHLTFIEMLGNFSIGDYSKKGAIRMAWECLTKIFKLPKQRLWITVFAGDATNVKDIETIKLWSAFVHENRISEHGRTDNWWGPPGTSGPCGPCSEIHYDLTGKACERGNLCKPNCPCNRFVEIWNLVFMEYYQDENGSFTELPMKNVDTGMGLERLAMVLQNVQSVFDTDLFIPLVKAVMRDGGFDKKTDAAQHVQKLRIVSDHLKSSAFLASNGIRFSNKEQGYILRRIFRRALDQLQYPLSTYPLVIDAIIATYKNTYPMLLKQRSTVLAVLAEEAEHYVTHLSTTLNKVIKRQKRTATDDGHLGKALTANEAFDLYSSHGIPIDRLKREGFQFDEKEVEQKIKEHKRKSRAGAISKFGGHGLGYSLDPSRFKPEDAAKMVRLHTATHLLHQALRTVLGTHVQQSGSDITPERLRFDFTHNVKLTAEQLTKIQQLINEQIGRDLTVRAEDMDLRAAIASGALSFFKEKYPARVMVYSIGDFSKELCGGPHVTHTAEIGSFRVLSEKSSAAGIRRIKATVTP